MGWDGVLVFGMGWGCCSLGGRGCGGMGCCSLGGGGVGGGLRFFGGVEGVVACSIVLWVMENGT